MWPFSRTVEEDDEVNQEEAGLYYGFSYEVGFQSGSNGNFHIYGFSNEASAEDARKRITEGLTKAMTDKSIVAVDVNLIINGADVAWFLVRAAKIWQ